MSTNVTPGPGSGQLPPAKKANWLLWVLAGCGGLIVIAALLALAGGLFVAHKAKQAGLDPDLMQKNPALAVTKMMATFNPDLEVLSVDERRGIITVRDKKDNKVLTINLEDAKKGKIVFQEQGKGAVAFEGSEGSLKVQSDEGTMEFGAGGKAPAWAPSYPGAKPEGVFQNKTAEGESGTFHFTVKDPPERVIQWYVAELNKAGMKTTSNAVQENGKTTGGMASAQDPGGKRSASVVVGYSEEGTSVTVTFGEKK